jgi:dihydrolipoamide dehydrogenase
MRAANYRRTGDCDARETVVLGIAAPPLAPPEVPLAEQQYDVVIIGSGPGGYVAAIRAGQLGLKVAVVEKDPFVGGTCLHRGCIPTKALLENADIWQKIQKAKDFGITVGDVTIDWSTVQKRKQGVVDQNAKGVEFLFKKNKVERVTGFGRVVKPGEVEVTAEGGEKKTLQTKNILLAMGSVPKDLPHIKADGKRIINSDHILVLDRIPESMLVIGAGAVGCEFASIFSRFGTKTTIVEVMPQLLPIEDEEISKEFTRIFKKKGIEILTGAKVLSCDVSDSGVKSVIETGKGKQQTIESEIVLSATGRRAVTENCGLENTKVKIDERGFVQVDELMRTEEAGIYAIGDIVPTPALAHCASAEGILAVEHMAGNEVRPLNYDHIPNATYTDPEVASVGLTEKAAKERGYEVKIGKFPFTANSKAKIVGDANGLVKYVTDAKYDELLGVHIVGPKATELIAEACAALELEATSESIARTVHSHPTLSEAMMEAAEEVTGHAIHF